MTPRGREWPIPPAFASAGQINALVPEGVAAGRATIMIESGSRMTRAVVRVEESAPGLFTPSGEPYGAAAAFAITVDGTREPAFACDGSGRCSLRAVSATAELEFAAGGLKPPPEVSVSVAGFELEVLGVSASAVAGVQTVRVRVPDTVRLRGILPVRIAAYGLVSAPVYVWLR